MKTIINVPWWSYTVPLLALILTLQPGFLSLTIYHLLASAALVGAVLCAVYHAEIIAHKVGEPYGTLILAAAVTVIEASLIVSLMIVGGKAAATTARDTVFAAVMIILTGIIGMSLLVGGYKFKEQKFGFEGVNAGLITLTSIAILTLVLPNHTTTVMGPIYSPTQLTFVAIISLILYGSFVMVQTGRHRDYFLPKGAEANPEVHAAPPTNRATVMSFLLLLVCLASVVLLAKKLSPVIEGLVVELGAPKALVGIIVAMVILLPEGLAALRASQKNRLQTSMNLALGSALASIGLTIPAVATLAMFTGMEVVLGIDTKSTVMLVLSLFTVSLSFGGGRTNVLQGVVLLVQFAVYLFITVFP